MAFTHNLPLALLVLCNFLVCTYSFAVKFECDFELQHDQQPTLRCLTKQKLADNFHERCEVPESVSNGGLVCLRNNSTRTVYCAEKCNPGFEMLSRTRAYHTCGPNIDWRNQTTFASSPCVPEFFPDIRLEAESAYFPAACTQLTAQQIQNEKEKVTRMLRDYNLCEDPCNDFIIKCGQTV